MVSLRFCHHALGIVAVAILVACGQSLVGTQDPSFITQAASVMPRASSLPIQPIGTQRLTRLIPKATNSKALIYVAVQYNDSAGVYIFPEITGNAMSIPISAITSGVDQPWGLYYGPNGTLYVADWGSNTVTAYPSGDNYARWITYAQDINRPMYSVVDSSGDVWISQANTGQVVEYGAHGGTTPLSVLQTGTASAAGVEADGMDFDTSGNLYVAYRTQYGNPDGSIEEFAPGSTTGTVLGMALNQPQGVVVDKNSNISVVETGGTNRIDYFPAGTTTPSFTITIPETPGQMALGKLQNRVYLSAEGGDVYLLAYPFTPSAEVRLQDTVPSGEPQGVAIAPNAQTF